MFSTTPRSKKGFTLLELIVVVVVLGILAALAIPSFSTVKQSAADKAAYNSAESVVRNAEALAAFDGAALNDTYLDTAGAETAGYNGSANTVTISSGGKTAVATINATTGAITVAGEAFAGTTFTYPNGGYQWNDSSLWFYPLSPPASVSVGDKICLAETSSQTLTGAIQWQSGGNVNLGWPVSGKCLTVPPSAAGNVYQYVYLSTVESPTGIMFSVTVN
jgi:type IV pilus assembly protein PilA